MERRRNAATLTIATFGRHPKMVREEIEREGLGLLSFLDPAAGRRDVRIELA